MNILNLIKELKFTYARSGGAGGQHVNKVETKVILHFDIEKSQELTEEEKELIKLKLANRINKEQKLLLASSDTRSQHKNKEKVTQKFITLIQQALKPKKKRKRTKPSKKANLKRLKRKRNQAEKKQRRQRPAY